MAMRKYLKTIPYVQFMYFNFLNIKARIFSAVTTPLIIHDYFKNYENKKLHIGCGFNRIKGWLNSDYFPRLSNVVHLDATKKFPFEDNSLDYIFSEHMIEHLTYADGEKMLVESFRVLKPHGKIRITTPDLAFVLKLYSKNKTRLLANYISWSCDNFIKNSEISDTFVINNFMRDWGHLFIYDDKTLRSLLNKIGYVDIQSYKINESDDPVLCDIENQIRMPDGFLQLESFTLEARKP